MWKDEWFMYFHFYDGESQVSCAASKSQDAVKYVEKLSGLDAESDCFACSSQLPDFTSSPYIFTN